MNGSIESKVVLPGCVVEHLLDILLPDHRFDSKRDKVRLVSVSDSA